MKTRTVTFIKYHISFAHDEGETVDLPEDEAKRAIDAGLAVAAEKSEKATAEQKGQTAVVDPVGDGAIKAATDQRAEAHATGSAIVASTNELGTAVVLPVGTEPDGTKVLIRPEDNKLADDKKKADKK